MIITTLQNAARRVIIIRCGNWRNPPQGKGWWLMSDATDHVDDLELFESIVGNLPFAVIVFDSKLRCVYINDEACEYAELPREKVIGKKVEEINPGVKRSSRYQAYLDTLKDGKARVLAFDTIPPGKKSRKLLHTTLYISRIQGHLVLVLRKINKELEQEVVLQALLSSHPAHIFVKNSDFEYIMVNDACAKFHGFSRDEVIGKTDYDFFEKHIADEIRAHDKRILFKGKTFNNIERPLYNIKGDVIWVLSTKAPLRDSEGNIIGIFGISTDITEERSARLQLSLLSEAIHQTEDAVVVTDTEGVIQYVNPAFERTTGYGTEEAIGQKPSVLKSGRHTDTFYKNLWETITSGECWSGHFVNKRADGALYEEDATISPVKNDSGEITHFVGVKRDVTLELEMETKLRQASKMQAIGRFAGGIAHDFNNVLTAILGYGGMLLSATPEDDPNRKKIEEIIKAGKRAEALTKQLLAFSKRQVIKKTKLDINQVLEDMKGLLLPIAGKEATLELQLGKKLPPAFADLTQVEQVILNLVINAKDALEGKEGGRVVVGTSQLHLDNVFSDGNFVAYPGQYVKIRVEDNGMGMDKNTLSRIFEPFFSTKGSKGTGMGLSSVYGIVKQHKGYILVSSGIGEGTAFEVHLPAMASHVDTVGSGKVKKVGETFQQGEGRVLIVEDEDAVLSLAASILSFAGYELETVPSAEEAIKVFKGLNGEIDLLLTDVILDGMDGLELADRLRKWKPDLRVLFMSGYVGKVVEKIDLKHPDNYFIAKPFTMESLTLAVGEAIAPRA